MHLSFIRWRCFIPPPVPCPNKSINGAAAGFTALGNCSKSGRTNEVDARGSTHRIEGFASI